MLLRTWLATVRHLETKSKIARVGGAPRGNDSFLPSFLASFLSLVPSFMLWRARST